MDCLICNGDGKRLTNSNLTVPSQDSLRCTTCKSIFAGSASQSELVDHYSNYYTKENLEIPTAVKNSLVRTVLTFSRFRTTENAFAILALVLDHCWMPPTPMVGNAPEVNIQPRLLQLVDRAVGKSTRATCLQETFVDRMT